MVAMPRGHAAAAAATRREQLERERDDADVQARDAEHVHQPRARDSGRAASAGIAAHVGDDERAHQRRVGAEHAIDPRARSRARSAANDRPAGSAVTLASSDARARAAPTLASPPHRRALARPARAAARATSSVARSRQRPARSRHARCPPGPRRLVELDRPDEAAARRAIGSADQHATVRPADQPAGEDQRRDRRPQQGARLATSDDDSALRRARCASARRATRCARRVADDGTDATSEQPSDIGASAPQATSGIVRTVRPRALSDRTARPRQGHG